MPSDTQEVIQARPRVARAAVVLCCCSARFGTGYARLRHLGAQANGKTLGSLLMIASGCRCDDRGPECHLFGHLHVSSVVRVSSLPWGGWHNQQRLSVSDC
jgi:hypothetical protein